MASTHLKNISQIGSFPQGSGRKNCSNHHPVFVGKGAKTRKMALGLHCSNKLWGEYNVFPHLRFVIHPRKLTAGGPQNDGLRLKRWPNVGIYVKLLRNLGIHQISFLAASSITTLAGFGEFQVVQCLLLLMEKIRLTTWDGAKTLQIMGIFTISTG